MARSAPAATSGGSAYTPAPDTAPAAVATAPAAGPDTDVEHPVVHRPHASAAPFQP